MAAEDRPQIYLVTPPVFDLEAFPGRLAAVLDAVEVACLRLALVSKDEDQLGRAADAMRMIAHERDVAVVIDTHVQLAARHGLDGVHLLDSSRSVRTARKVLGADAIVGAYCGASRDAAKVEKLTAAMHAHFAWEAPPGCPAELPLYLLTISILNTLTLIPRPLSFWSE